MMNFNNKDVRITDDEHKIFLNLTKNSHITNASTLSYWMIKNIKYQDYSKAGLQSIPELIHIRYGCCHDQTVFVFKFLKYLGYDPKILFLYTTIGDNIDRYPGPTHSLVYFYYGKGVYWFENAWEAESGIHYFYTFDEMIDTIKNRMKETIKSETPAQIFPKYDVPVSMFREHISLDELVKSVFDTGIEDDSSKKYMKNEFFITKPNRISMERRYLNVKIKKENEE